MNSPIFLAALAVAGVFTVLLGVVHLWIPGSFASERPSGRMTAACRPSAT
jgi:hypothetical protein